MNKIRSYVQTKTSEWRSVATALDCEGLKAIEPQLSQEDKEKFYELAKKCDSRGIRELYKALAERLDCYDKLNLMELRTMAIRRGLRDYLSMPKMMLAAEIRKYDANQKKQKDDNGHISDTRNTKSDSKGGESDSTGMV